MKTIWKAEGRSILLGEEGDQFKVAEAYDEDTARLIAASPELFDALLKMLRCYSAGDMDSMANAVDDALAALNKADGA